MTEATPLEPSAPGSPDVEIATLEPLIPTPAPEPEVVLPPAPAVQSTRRLLGASFDLLTQSTAAMRRASFYIGAIVLATVGPLAIATVVLDVTSPRGLADFGRIARTAAAAWYGVLAILAYAGLIVAAVESRTMAVAILGGRYAGRPIGVTVALARSRMAFWRAVAASIIVTVPVSIATNIVDSAVVRLSNGSTGASLIVAFVIGILIGAPLAYLLTGIVLGDVGAIEATRRSIRVFKARKMAAALVAGFEFLAIGLVILGLGAGLGLVVEVTDALGIGTHSGPLALALIAAGVVVAVFAFGTLIFTALAISIAPQVVMFVGLTHATIGLDHVRPGGDHDPAVRRKGHRPFHWLPIPMWLGIGFGIIGLFGLIVTLSS